jgi:hypothetical protein
MLASPTIGVGEVREIGRVNGRRIGEERSQENGGEYRIGKNTDYLARKSKSLSIHLVGVGTSAAIGDGREVHLVSGGSGGCVSGCARGCRVVRKK